jgi:undecaprenyl-diphosphatase
MDIITAVFMGIIQGLTEFFPVSSSGHLVITAHLVRGFNQPGVLFEVILHAGTMVAVLFYFKSKILNLTKNYLLYLAIGTIPAAVIGFLLQGFFESLFDQVRMVGFALLITSLLNFLTDKQDGGSRKINTKVALSIGLFQAFAIVPGVSRSGSTIFAGVKSKLDRKTAAEFSFLLSIPAIVGANILQIFKYSSTTDLKVEVFAAGFLASLISGYFAIKWVIRMLESKRFIYFSVYTLVMGVLVIITS